MTSNNIQTSGGIFTHHFVESLQQDSLNHPAVAVDTFIIAPQTRLSQRDLESQVASAWADLVERWDAVEREFNSLDITALRQRWLKPLFAHLGFSLDFLKADQVLEEELRFPISHIGRTGNLDISIPIHTVLYHGEATLETKAQPGRGIKALAPHDMLQRYLNLNKRYRWGMVTDGVYLRLLRDFYHSYTRGYTEFDLQGIFSSRDYAGFRAMYRLLHASRFVIPEGKETAPIDDLYDDALAMGVKVGEDLRTNVQAAIEALANGFLVSTPGFMDRVRKESGGAGQLYRDILMTIYRMLFLLFAEQRGMLPGRGSLYMEEFSLTAFRALAEQPLSEDRNHDLWEKLKTTFSMVEHGVSELKIFAYNGALFSLSRTPLVTPADQKSAPYCRNDYLLQTIRHLTTVEKDHVLQRISYADLSVEEIGSIYESLLDITPRITETAVEADGRQVAANTFYLDPRGGGRKTTGSYYTPPSLVNELIKSALVPVMLDRVRAVVPGYDPELVEALNKEEKVAAETALLSIKVVDPAAGSGAFLIAANNKLGLELARIRTGSVFPPEVDIRRARRDVLAHCIHGVDLNPMAVELCKVSLWINAAVEDAPLNFLDHHIQCGNSLVGATPALVKSGIPDGAYNPVTGDDRDFAAGLKRLNRAELSGQGRLELRVTELKTREDVSHFSEVRELAETNPSQAERAYYTYWGSEDYWTRRLPYDLWTAAFFAPLIEGAPVPTTHDVRQALADPKLVPPEKRRLARELAQQHHFFHWHLSFPEVYDQQGNGGFDVVLGNPPWERIKLQEEEFFAVRAPGIASAPNKAARERLIRALSQTDPALLQEFNAAKHMAECSSKFMRFSQRFLLTAVGDVNLYALFAEQFRNLMNPHGRIGVIVPTGIATDDTTKDFFGDLVEKRAIASLFDFENREGLFPGVHRSYKFCLLTLSGAPVKQAQFIFFATRVDHLRDERRRFSLDPLEIALFNPNTRTMPVFRTRADAELTRAIYQRVPVLVNERNGENPWGVSFLRMFDMSNDSHLFVSEPREGYVRLYEAKMFWHYDHRWATFDGDDTRDVTLAEKQKRQYIVMTRYFVPAQEVFNRLSPLKHKWLFTFRGITNATNERSMVASIIPLVGVGNSAPIFLFDKITPTLCACLDANSACIPFDYTNRFKIGGTNLNFFIVKQFPIIPQPQYSRNNKNFVVSRVVELTYTAYDLQPFAEDVLNEIGIDNWNEWFPHNPLAADGSPQPFRWDEDRRALLRAELDAYYAALYGLNRKQLRYILDPADLTERELADILDPWEEVADPLDPTGYNARRAASDFPGETFRVLKEKEFRQFGEYRTRRLVLEAWERLSASGELPQPTIEKNSPPVSGNPSGFPHPDQSQPPVPQPNPPVAARPPGSAPPVLNREGISPTIVPAKPAQTPVHKNHKLKPDKTLNVNRDQEIQPSLSDFGLYKCTSCGKLVMGYEKENHQQEQHGGNNVEWIKKR